MVLLPVVLAGLARRRFRVPWLLFSLGMLTFGLSQVLHIPFNRWLTEIGWIPANPLQGAQPLWRTALTLGLSAGIFEEIARVAGFAVLQRFPALCSRSNPVGLMVGLGHGGLESMIFGGLFTTASVGALLSLVGTDLAALNLPPDQTAALQSQMDLLVSRSLWNAFLPLLERMLAIGLQVSLSVMVLRAFQRNQPLWVVLAIAYHALVDGVLVVASVYLDNPLWIEAVLALLSFPAYYWLFIQLKREKAVHYGTSLRHEATILGVVLQKELFQQVRTGRVLVIAMILGLFGMLSPLLAYLTPELLKMIPGAEAFAGLIPPPTAGDAMLQYHKNITQFGFIIVLLLGMGAVAGEKESGAASIILSKPVTRWTFLLGKLLAQALTLAGGLLVAMFCAHLYTAYLFATPDFWLFATMNLVLLAWLLPYVALTLLGSVLGKSTPGAAGFGLAGSVMLLGLSSLPPLASLMPGALSNWALRLGIQAAGIQATTPGIQVDADPSQAALIMSLILVLCCYYVALGVFEQQEI
jgi:ABC-2 type transport system permease protein